MYTQDPGDLQVDGVAYEISGRLLKTVRIPVDREDFFEVEDPEKVVAEVKRTGRQADIFCFWQRLPESKPKYPYHMEWDNIAALPISTYQEWVEKSVHKSVRKKIRKAERLGVETRIAPYDAKLVAGIRRIFNETPVRQGRPFAHYGEGFEAIQQEWAIDLDHSVFVGAYFRDELIGFVKLTFGKDYAKTSGTLAMIAHRDKAPMNALIAKCVEHCARQGVPYLTYGTFVYGRKGEDSLTDFKRYNGFKRVDLPRYYVPLSPRGRIAVKLGLHRKLSEFLPRKLLLKLLDWRNAYYLRRIESSS